LSVAGQAGDGCDDAIEVDELKTKLNMDDLFARIIEELIWWVEQGMVALPFCTHDHSGMTAAHCDRCSSMGKAPLVRWAELLKVTEEELARWLSVFTRCNVGLRMGAVNKLVGVDIDGALGEELLAKHCPDLPPTPTFTTPGGGRRLLFHLPDGVKAAKRSFGRQDRVHEELAVLGEGAVTVAPPSIHASGGVYEYVVGHEPWNMALATVPESVLRLSAGGASVDAAPTFDQAAGEATLATLAAKCPKFQRDWDTQRDDGVDEDAWFCWSALLVGSGRPDAAWAFSTASRKHNQRSSARIRRLVDDAEGRSAGTVRCQRLGCGHGQVRQCFGKIEWRGMSDFANSPGGFIAVPRPPGPQLKRTASERKIVGFGDMFE